MHTKSETCKGVISLDFIRNLTSFLNPSKNSICRITGRINFQILGPKYDADSLPW